MTDPVDRLEWSVQNLQNRLDRLTGDDEHLDLSELPNDVEELHETVESCSRSVESLNGQIEFLRDKLGDVDSTSTDAVQAGERLEQQLRILERRVRASTQIPVADLDHWPDSCAKLAVAVRKGWAVQPSLLTEYEQNRLQARIDRPAALLNDHHTRITEAGAAARTMATVEYHDRDAWDDAIVAWNAAVTALQELNPRILDARQDAQKAQQELDAARERHNTALPAAQRGTRSWERLLATIRTRIDNALRDEHLLPPWLETTLGPGMPRQHPDEWRDTAVRIVAYRLVCTITDPASALGDRPNNYGPQQALHDELIQACHRYRT